MPVKLEVIASSIADAIAAERGGADRIELVRALDKGGLTPSLELVAEVLASVRIPVRVMLREEEDFFAAGAKKVERLCTLARSCADLRAHGLVLGFLRRNGTAVEVNHEIIQAILDAAPALSITFHRAFEELTDPLTAIHELKHYRQLDRILASDAGQPPCRTDAWPDKLQRLAALASVAAPAITMLVGGGVNAATIEWICQNKQQHSAAPPWDWLREIHAGTLVRARQSVHGAVRAPAVRRLVRQLQMTPPSARAKPSASPAH